MTDNKLKYKYILFDNDGTLADTLEAIMVSFRFAMREVLGQNNPDEAKYQDMIGLPLRDQFMKFSDDPKVVDQLCQTYRSNNTKQLERLIKNFEGLPQALEKLHSAGYSLGVVTSKIHNLTISGLEQLGIRQYFGYIQGADDWPVHKPDPGAISHAVEQLKLSPNEVLYVGDAPFDLIAGNGAGVDTCSVTWGAFSKDKLLEHNPTYIIDSPAELLEILL